MDAKEPGPVLEWLTANQRFVTLAGVGVFVVAAGFLLPFAVTRGRPLPPQNIKAAPAKEAVAAAPLDEEALLTRVGVSTLVVLGALVGTTLGLRRWLVRQAAPVGSDLQILGAARIDNRSQVYVVEARGQRLLVGTDPTGIKLLAVVPAVEPGDVAEEAAEPALLPYRVPRT